MDLDDTAIRHAGDDETCRRKLIFGASQRGVVQPNLHQLLLFAVKPQRLACRGGRMGAIAEAAADPGPLRIEVERELDGIDDVSGRLVIQPPNTPG